MILEYGPLFTKPVIPNACNWLLRVRSLAFIPITSINTLSPSILKVVLSGIIETRGALVASEKSSDPILLFVSSTLPVAGGG